MFVLTSIIAQQISATLRNGLGAGSAIQTRRIRANYQRPGFMANFLPPMINIFFLAHVLTFLILHVCANETLFFNKFISPAGTNGKIITSLRIRFLDL